jgi:hypothetical protein
MPAVTTAGARKTVREDAVDTSKRPQPKAKIASPATVMMTAPGIDKAVTNTYTPK